MEVSILGTGCPKCNKLERVVSEVIKENRIEATVKKIKDVNEIAKAGVMLTPALMIDGDVKFSGKLPSKDDLVTLLNKK